MNQVAIVFGLIITSVIGFGAYTALAPLVTQSENRNMEGELVNVINAASEYRWVNRNKTTRLAGADFEELVESGYLDSELYDDGDGESVIETDITASPGATPSVVTYDAGDPSSCDWLLDRATTGKWTRVDAGATANDCSDAGVITVVIR